MKTYRKAKDMTGKELDSHVIVEENGRPVEVITQKKHPAKWAEYQESLLISEVVDKIDEDEAPKAKKTKKKKS